MRAAACFQNHLDRRQLLEEWQQFPPPDIAPQHRSAGVIDPVQREHSLGRVDGNSLNLAHGRSPVRVLTTELWHQMPRGRPPQRNIGTARQPVPSPPSRRPSTASLTCVRSSAAATAATSNISPVSMTSRPAFAPSTASPNPVPSTAATSEGSTFSAAPNRPSSQPSSAPPSTSPASAAPPSCHYSANPLPPPSLDNSPVSATSASSNASPARIATISPAPAAPPSPPAAASPNTPSFLRSPDKSAHTLQTLNSKGTKVVPMKSN